MWTFTPYCPNRASSASNAHQIPWSGFRRQLASERLSTNHPSPATTFPVSVSLIFASWTAMPRRYPMPMRRAVRPSIGAHASAPASQVRCRGRSPLGRQSSLPPGFDQDLRALAQHALAGDVAAPDPVRLEGPEAVEREAGRQALRRDEVEAARRGHTPPGDEGVDLARADAACEARAAVGASAEVVVEGRVAVGVGDDDARVPRRADRVGGASPVRPLHLRAGEDGGVDAGEERAGRERSEGAGAGRAAQ